MLVHLIILCGLLYCWLALTLFRGTCESIFHYLTMFTLHTVVCHFRLQSLFTMPFLLQVMGVVIFECLCCQGTVNPLPYMASNALGYGNFYNSRYQTESVSTGQTGLSELVPHYPERPEQPECQYFMKTGRCKFGSDCKYHHPKERLASSDAYDLGPYGLPLRPVCYPFSRMFNCCHYYLV